MQSVLGIMFIDQAEILVRIFQKGKTKLIGLTSINYDLDTFIKNNRVDSTSLTYMILKILLDFQMVGEWKVMAREIDEETVSEIAFKTKLKIHELTFLEEQRMIVDGIAASQMDLFR